MAKQWFEALDLDDIDEGRVRPVTGKPPGGFDDGVDAFPVEVRDDGAH